MKFNKSFLALPLLTLMCSSCFLLDNKSSLEPNVQYYAVKVDRDSNWSFIGPDGKLLYEEEFKNCPSAIIDGVFSVYESEGYSLYSAKDSKKPVLIGDCENLAAAGYASEGLIGVVRPKERITFINLDGETKLTLEPIGGKEVIYSASAFINGTLNVCVEGQKWGTINTKGEVLVEPQYYSLGTFNDGIAYATKEKDGKTSWLLINKKGEELANLKDKYTLGGVFKHGRMLACENKDDAYRFGFVDKKGEFTKLPASVKSVRDFNDKVIIYYGGDGWGVMDLDGEVIVRPKYDEINFLNGSSNYIARTDNKVYILNKKGERTDTSLDINSFVQLIGKDFGFIGADGDEYALYNSDGEPVNKKLEFKDYGIGIEQSALRSAYININSMVANIVNEINADGICGIKLNENPQPYLNNTAYYYRYDRSFYPADNFYTEGLNYSYNISLVRTAGEISEQIYETRTYGYYYTYTYTVPTGKYRFNSNCRINAIELDVHLGVDDLWKDIKKPLISALKNKGFDLNTENSNSLIFTKNGNVLTVTTPSSALIEILLSTYDAAPTKPNAVFEEAPVEAVEAAE